MKKYYVAGLAILLPIVLTLMIIRFFINFLTNPFLEQTKLLINQLPIFQDPILYIDGTTLISILSKSLILLFLFGFIILIGLLGKHFLVEYLFRWGDYIFHKVPYVNKVYKACQEVVHSLFSSSSKSFSQVVFAPFPQQGCLCLGLVACDAVQIEFSKEQTQDWISVFIPGTPNPSVGYLLLFKKEQLIFVNMKIDEAMKFIMSCGAASPEFTTHQPYATHDQSLS